MTPTTGGQSLLYRNVANESRMNGAHRHGSALDSKQPLECSGHATREMRRGTNRLSILLVLICVFGISVPLDAGPREDGPREVGNSAIDQTPSEPADAISIEQLSDNNYSRRQAATMQMWRLRESSRQAVQDAARHPDPEVADRANWILRQWRRGALPETPPELARLLQQNDDPSVLEELLEVGQFGAVVVAVEESAGTAQRTLLNQRLASALTRRFPVYVRRAYQDGLLLDLLRLVDLVADSKEMAVCRVQLMQELEIDVDDEHLLPQAAKNWTPIVRNEAEVVVLAVLGRMDDAIARAREYGDESLLRICQMLIGDWQTIAKETAVAAAQSPTNSPERSRLWCQALVAADRANDNDIRKQAVDELVGIPITVSDASVDLRWKTLASHGFVDEALTVLTRIENIYDAVKRPRSDSAAVVAIASARTDRAFEILDYPYEEIDTNLRTWIAEAIQEQTQDTLDAKTLGVTPRVAPKLNRLLSLMRCLLAVGREQDAWTIARDLTDSGAIVGSQRIRDTVLITLLVTNRDDWIARLAVRPGEAALTSETQRMLVAGLSDIDSKTWEMILESISAMMPAIPFDQRVQIAFDFCSGEIPNGFENNAVFRQLYQTLTSNQAYFPASGQRSLVRRTVPRRLNLQIATLFSQLGQAEIATEILANLAASGDIAATFSMAERELDLGRAESASAGFDRVWKSVAATPRPSVSAATVRYIRQDPEQIHFAAKATVAQWILARRQGHATQAASLQQQLRLMLCSPAMEVRSELLEYLGDRGEKEITLQAYRRLLPMAAFGSEGATELYDVARNYSSIVREADPIDAAKWFDLAIGGTLETTFFRSVAYISLPVFVRRWQLEGAIENGDELQVKRHLDRIYELDPLDIDVAERLLPKMRAKGMDKIADTSFYRVWEAGLAYIAAYPFDATAGNNLAWIAAMNKRELSEASRLSEQAVYFEPESAIYRDTLAEILFLLGRVDEALQIESGCLLDDPGQWHLHEQIEKYSEAMPE
ncbi:tetratricopeptide repeat protein [Novipirellula sp. SH528]|uniref:tetratricopeptide repeat protein n=1 Tax=Novipirellula sp. SH528 TaxID=3454466 RepID=UPI003FA16801